MKFFFFLTSENFVEGFNVQNFDLEIVCFMNSCRQASKIMQAIGRAVRPRKNQVKNTTTVKVIQLTPSDYTGHLETRFDMASKGTALMALLSQSPSLVILLVALDTLHKNNENLEAMDSELQSMISAIQKQLDQIANAINLLKNSENFWAEAIVSDNSLLLEYPFIFQSNNLGLSAGNLQFKQSLDSIYSCLFSSIDSSSIYVRFSTEIGSRKLHELLTPSCIKLVGWFRLIPTLLKTISEKWESEKDQLASSKHVVEKLNLLADLVSKPSTSLFMLMENNFALVLNLKKQIVKFLKDYQLLDVRQLLTYHKFKDIFFGLMQARDYLNLIISKIPAPIIQQPRASINLVVELANLFWQLEYALSLKGDLKARKEIQKIIDPFAKNFADLICESSKSTIQTNIKNYCSALNYLAFLDLFDREEINVSVLTAYENLIKMHPNEANEILVYLLEYHAKLKESDNSYYIKLIQFCFKTSVAALLSPKGTDISKGQQSKLLSLFPTDSFELFRQKLIDLGATLNVAYASGKISSKPTTTHQPKNTRKKPEKKSLFSEELIKNICDSITALDTQLAAYVGEHNSRIDDKTRTDIYNIIENLNAYQFLKSILPKELIDNFISRKITNVSLNTHSINQSTGARFFPPHPGHGTNRTTVSSMSNMQMPVSSALDTKMQDAPDGEERKEEDLDTLFSRVLNS